MLKSLDSGAVGDECVLRWETTEIHRVAVGMHWERGNEFRRETAREPKLLRVTI